MLRVGAVMSGPANWAPRMEAHLKRQVTLIYKGTTSLRIGNCYQVAVKVLRAVKMKRADSVSLRMLKRMHREVNGIRWTLMGRHVSYRPWFENGDVLNYLKKHPFVDRRKLGVVHGDLKGGNVLVDSSGDASLCDFGLAKLLRDCPSSFTTSNIGMGTLRWCAPGLAMTFSPIGGLDTDMSGLVRTADGERRKQDASN
ncbi:hypothetical protein FRB98_007658 [Tulasnella sp. 332]|nr:hypothetical protein FRB98_007658 [Tulasnella sp. 332]